MKASFWHRCWEKNRLGFHQKSIHPFLSQYLLPLIALKSRLSEPNTPQTVFVPLCGKSDDMVWLAEHCEVIGAELSEIACRDFFDEKNISVLPKSVVPSTSEENLKSKGVFKQYTHQNITLWQGDFFKLCHNQLPVFDWIYDRAAIIALPANMQQSYASHLSSFMNEHSQLFLISLELPQEELEGPPFAIFEQDIERLFSGFKVQCIAEQTLEDKVFAQRKFNVSYLKEKLYLITKP
jgi:thiopurine S-methyltransferase